MLLVTAFVLIGWLWMYARGLNEKLAELRRMVFEQSVDLKSAEANIKALQKTRSAVSVPQGQQPRTAEKPTGTDQRPTAQHPPVHPADPAPASQAVPSRSPQPTSVLIPAAPQAEPKDNPEHRPISEPAPSFAERIKTAGGWEELIGGNVLNKLGALILVIGVALFLSYSFAHMGPAGIASTAAAFSFATLLGGTILERRERYRIFSNGLIAAGWAGLYFTAYAINALPAARIIDSPVAGMSLMVLVAAGMVAHSLRYQVQSLTSLAFGCVFGALALSNQNTLVAVALIPLAASMLLLARRFQWYGMSLFSAAATYATFLTRPSTDTPLGKIQILLFIFWLMFEAFDIWRAKAGQEEWPASGSLFGLNALAGLGASAAVWYRLAPDSMWQFCVGAALLYLASTWIRCALGGQTLYEFALVISSLFAGLAIFSGVAGLWISLGMIAEAEALYLAGRYLNLRFARLLSMFGFAAAAMQLAGRISMTPTVIWGASIDPWVPPLVVMALVFYFNRSRAKEDRYFGYLGSAFLILVIGAELPWRYAGAVALVYGMLLLELGIRRGLIDFRFQGYGVTALGAIGAAFSYLDPLHVPNVWTYGFATALALGVSVRATRSLTTLPESERRALRIGGAIGTAGLSAALATRVFPEPYWESQFWACR